MFEELARAKAKGQRVAFVKVDLGVGMGSAVAREFGVAAMPMFDSFLGGEKVRVWGLPSVSRISMWAECCLRADS